MIPKFLSKQKAIQQKSPYVKPIVASVCASVCASVYFTLNPLMSTHVAHEFIKADDNRYLNISIIRWAKEDNKCWYICAHEEGCRDHPFKFDKFVVCDPTSYDYLSDMLNR